MLVLLLLSLPTTFILITSFICALTSLSIVPLLTDDKDSAIVVFKKVGKGRIVVVVVDVDDADVIVDDDGATFAWKVPDEIVDAFEITVGVAEPMRNG